MRFSLINRHGHVSDDTHELVKRRFLFALSRYSSKIDRVSVVITDVNGPKGGIGMSCRVIVKFKRLGTVTVTCTDSELVGSVARAADRVDRAVARTIEKSQRWDRRRIRRSLSAP